MFCIFFTPQEKYLAFLQTSTANSSK